MKKIFFTLFVLMLVCSSAFAAQWQYIGNNEINEQVYLDVAGVTKEKTVWLFMNATVLNDNDRAESANMLRSLGKNGDDVAYCVGINGVDETFKSVHVYDIAYYDSRWQQLHVSKVDKTFPTPDSGIMRQIIDYIANNYK